MITKPEQATPHTAHLFTEAGNMAPVYMKAFTAKETAQIAKAYLAAYLKEKRALLRPDSEHKKASANLRAWRSKFKEWGEYQ